MDRLIKEQLESLLHDTTASKRLGRRILNLAGFLSPSEQPEHIREQLSRLSRLVVQQDAFDALLEPVSLMARSTANFTDLQAIQSMIASLEAARKSIESTEDINFAELIGWLVNQAQVRKIIKIKPIDVPV
ncbi:hypothetical protein HG264_05515 [Pseudomonas sp. gcc21]|uniref:hypothetical protein n=1 Tax=Pseudomonas sp. gcc21 TaxID=2726989 RepID=UPI0014515CE0|nr:hypothetical protein [Pseudomonas sp. gcc21]QJD58406.1 hypothetical protein HG264_05515 [Pseudomonas sp. gcc21]